MIRPPGHSNFHRRSFFYCSLRSSSIVVGSGQTTPHHHQHHERQRKQPPRLHWQPHLPGGTVGRPRWRQPRPLAGPCFGFAHRIPHGSLVCRHGHDACGVSTGSLVVVSVGLSTPPRCSITLARRWRTAGGRTLGSPLPTKAGPRGSGVGAPLVGFRCGASLVGGCGLGGRRTEETRVMVGDDGMHPAVSMSMRQESRWALAVSSSRETPIVLLGRERDNSGV